MELSQFCYRQGKELDDYETVPTVQKLRKMRCLQLKKTK